MEENNTNTTNNQNKPSFNGTNKRTFTESEQNSGSYNVGMKKSKTNFALSDKIRKSAAKKLDEINPNLNLENITQDTLLTKTAGRQHQQSSSKNSNNVMVIFLGGIGEIGKNITAIECGNDMIIIDCGLAFPSEDMPGVDLVIPDFTYIKENSHKLRGIVITHGHEDHIGSLPYLLRDVNAPIYASKMTLTLLDNKIREHKLQNIKGVCVNPGYSVKLGCSRCICTCNRHSCRNDFPYRRLQNRL